MSEPKPKYQIEFMEFGVDANWIDWTPWLLNDGVISKKVESDNPADIGVVAFDTYNVTFRYEDIVRDRLRKPFNEKKRYLFRLSIWYLFEDVPTQKNIFYGVLDFMTITYPLMKDATGEIINIVSFDILDKLSSIAMLREIELRDSYYMELKANPIIQMSPISSTDKKITVYATDDVDGTSILSYETIVYYWSTQGSDHLEDMVNHLNTFKVHENLITYFRAGDIIKAPADCGDPEIDDDASTYLLVLEARESSLAIYGTENAAYELVMRQQIRVFPRVPTGTDWVIYYTKIWTPRMYDYTDINVYDNTANGGTDTTERTDILSTVVRGCYFNKYNGRKTFWKLYDFAGGSNTLLYEDAPITDFVPGTLFRNKEYVDLSSMQALVSEFLEPGDYEVTTLLASTFPDSTYEYGYVDIANGVRTTLAIESLCADPHGTTYTANVIITKNMSFTIPAGSPKQFYVQAVYGKDLKVAYVEIKKPKQKIRQDSAYINKYYYEDAVKAFRLIGILESLISYAWGDASISYAVGALTDADFRLPYDYFNQLIMKQPFLQHPFDALKYVVNTFGAYLYVTNDGNFKLAVIDNLSTDTPIGSLSLNGINFISGTKKEFWDKLTDAFKVTAKTWMRITLTDLNGVISDVALDGAGVAYSFPDITPHNLKSKDVLVTQKMLTDIGMYLGTYSGSDPKIIYGGSGPTKKGGIVIRASRYLYNSDGNVLTDQQNALNVIAEAFAEKYFSFYGKKHVYYEISCTLTLEMFDWLPSSIILVDGVKCIIISLRLDKWSKIATFHLVAVEGEDYSEGSIWLGSSTFDLNSSRI